MYCTGEAITPSLLDSVEASSRRPERLAGSDWRVVSNRFAEFAGICCKVGPQRVSRFVERGLGVGSTSRGLFSTGWLEATGSSHWERCHRRLPSCVSASRVNTKAAGLMCPAGARRARELASAAWRGARPMAPSVTRPDAGSLSIEEY